MVELSLLADASGPVAARAGPDLEPTVRPATDIATRAEATDRVGEPSTSML
jgi:hypothetical protein